MARLDHAFRHGSRLALHHARWILPFSIVSLVLGLLQSWPLLVVGGAAANPLAARLARGDLDAAVDLFLGRPEALAYAGLWTLVAVALVPIYGLAYSFWSGGIVSIAAGGRPFWTGGRRTFWSFTALGLLLLLLLALTAAVGLLLGDLLGRGSLAIAAVLVALANTLGEYARAAAAVDDRRNPFVLLVRAVRFCARHLPGVLVLSAAGFLLHAALLGGYAWAANWATGGLVGVALQQLIALLFVWIKALRLIWATTYMRADKS